jgi:hypothetical protein
MQLVVGSHTGAHRSAAHTVRSTAAAAAAGNCDVQHLPAAALLQLAPLLLQDASAHLTAEEAAAAAAAAVGGLAALWVVAGRHPLVGQGAPWVAPADQGNLEVPAPWAAAAGVAAAAGQVVVAAVAAAPLNLF